MKMKYKKNKNLYGAPKLKALKDSVVTEGPNFKSVVGHKKYASGVSEKDLLVDSKGKKKKMRKLR